MGKRARKQTVQNMAGETLAERFWGKVQKRGPDECWLWTGCRNPCGYGCIGSNKRVLKAHRVSWELHNGPIPSGVGHHGTCVLHRCDVHACVNPAHLFLGTHQDNMDDREAKGRGRIPHVTGERHGSAKLTNELVIKARQMLADGLSEQRTADAIGISRGSIHAIKVGKTWKMVTTSPVI